MKGKITMRKIIIFVVVIILLIGLIYTVWKMYYQPIGIMQDELPRTQNGAQRPNTKQIQALDTLLQKTTFLSEDLSGESVKKLVFDNTYKIEDDGTTYRLLRDQAAVGDKYIFAVIAESGGGSGVFYGLHAVDKQTLRTVNTVGLGDRVRIEKMSIVDKSNDVLSITYWTKGDGFEPSQKIEDTFQIKSNSNKIVRNPER